MSPQIIESYKCSWKEEIQLTVELVSYRLSLATQKTEAQVAADKQKLNLITAKIICGTGIHSKQKI